MDLVTGKLSGSVYSANCGWISLSNAFAHVQTGTIKPGTDSDGDGIADAWELSFTNTLTAFTISSDTDGDGVSDLNEYFADTNPSDANSKLVITAFSTPPDGTSPNVTWNSVLKRQYRIGKTLSLNPPAWLDSGLGLIVPDRIKHDAQLHRHERSNALLSRASRQTAESMTGFAAPMVTEFSQTSPPAPRL